MIEEFGFILDFAKEMYFEFRAARQQLRSLWTAYCLHNDMECDTAKYDNDIRAIYNVVAKNKSCQWVDNEEEGIVGFDLFDLFMGEELS